MMLSLPSIRRARGVLLSVPPFQFVLIASCHIFEISLFVIDNAATQSCYLIVRC